MVCELCVPQAGWLLYWHRVAPSPGLLGALAFGNSCDASLFPCLSSDAFHVADPAPIDVHMFHDASSLRQVAPLLLCGLATFGFQCLPASHAFALVHRGIVSPVGAYVLLPFGPVVVHLKDSVACFASELHMLSCSWMHLPVIALNQ